MRIPLQASDAADMSRKLGCDFCLNAELIILMVWGLGFRVSGLGFRV